MLTWHAQHGAALTLLLWDAFPRMLLLLFCNETCTHSTDTPLISLGI